jgi:hypothetical protein
MQLKQLDKEEDSGKLLEDVKRLSQSAITYIVVGLSFYIITSYNPLQTAAAIFVFGVNYLCFFHKSDIRSVLFWGVNFQWLAISIKIFYANYLVIPLSEVFSYYSNPYTIDDAFWYSIIGLFFFIVGMHWVANKKAFLKPFLNTGILAFDPKKIIYLYLLFSLLAIFLNSSKGFLGGLSYPIAYFLKLKWGFLFIAFIICFKKNEYLKTFLVIIFFEFLLSFASYFSSFKEYIIVLVVAFTLILSEFKGKYIVFLILLFMVLFRFGLVWTAIKGDYREYISGGGGQRVSVSTTDALSYFYTLVSNVDNSIIEDAMDGLIDRIGYIDFFSLTLSTVPETIPHQNGEIWKQAVTHMFMPRIFFPNKPSIDDSAHTSKYTGQALAGQAQGASHSLGYMADSYIDFGPVWMFIPVFLLGTLFGLVYNYFLKYSFSPIWALLYIFPLFQLIGAYGTNAIKLISNIVIYFLVVYLFNKFVPEKIEKIIKSS